MRIRFPFSVTQIDSKVVEIDMSMNGRPLVEVTLHPEVVKAMQMKEPGDYERFMDEQVSKLSEEVVKASMTVEL